MFEIEKMEQQFDYSLVDNDTAKFLRSCEYEINGIAEDARVKFGEVLKKAQDKLSRHHDGVFRKWFESGGLDKNNVYYYIGLYQSSRNLDNTQKDNFLKAPKTVQKKVMQKNIPNEIKEAVLSGEVTTNKELEELKHQLKQREQENDILQKQLEEAENKPPEVIEKYSEPDDYEFYKRSYKELEETSMDYARRISDLQGKLHNMKLKQRTQNDDDKAKKYDELNQAINEMNGKLTEGQLRLKNQKYVYELVKKSEELIKEVAPLVYVIDQIDIDDNDYAKKPLSNIAKSLDEISKEIKNQLKEKEIIEVN